MTTGEHLLAARQAAGLSRGKLAAAAGLSEAALAGLEADKVALRRTIAMKLAWALGVSVGQLLGWNRALPGGGQMVSLPVLGIIRAGLPAFAGEGAATLLPQTARGKFFLRADSDWPEAGICRGMQLLFDAGACPAAGDLVACAIGPEGPLLYRWQPAGPGSARLFGPNGQSKLVSAREFETGWAELFGVAQDRVQVL